MSYIEENDMFYEYKRDIFNREYKSYHPIGCVWHQKNIEQPLGVKRLLYEDCGFLAPTSNPTRKVINITAPLRYINYANDGEN